MRHFIVTDHQAGKLPRRALLLLCALYVFPGLIGREPWRTDDAPGFATTLSMVRGGWQDWLIPNIAGLAQPDEGPLAYALLALLNKALSLLFGHTLSLAPWSHWLAMLGAAAGLALMLLCFWYSAYRLAKRPGLQPLDPFGAAASRIDFARAIADTALLVLIASLGLLVRMHEISSVAAQVTGIAFFLWAMAFAIEHPRRGGFFTGLACAAIFITKSPVLAFGLVLACAFLMLFAPAFKLGRRRFFPTFFATVLPGFALWPLLLTYTLPSSTLSFQDHYDLSGAQFLWLWWHEQSGALGTPSVEGLIYLARTLPWYFWPAWPLAAYSVWRWKARASEAALALPATVLAMMAILWIIHPKPNQQHLAVAAPVIALLAAPGLATLRKSLVNMIDWFAVMCYSFVGVVVWLYWFALITGFPEKVAFSATRFAPGFILGPIWVEIVLGGLATASWLLLVNWRISRQPPMIWRAVVLSASGLTLLWFLLMTLFLPVLNERMSFRSPAEAMAQKMAQSEIDGQVCTSAKNLSDGARASFFYYAQLRFRSAGRQAESAPCALTLEQASPSTPLDARAGDLLWRGSVSAYRDDEFRLYRRPTEHIRSPRKH